MGWNGRLGAWVRDVGLEVELLRREYGLVGGWGVRRGASRPWRSTVDWRRSFKSGLMTRAPRMREAPAAGCGTGGVYGPGCPLSELLAIPHG